MYFLSLLILAPTSVAAAAPFDSPRMHTPFRAGASQRGPITARDVYERSALPKQWNYKNPLTWIADAKRSGEEDSQARGILPPARALGGRFPTYQNEAGIGKREEDLEARSILPPPREHGRWPAYQMTAAVGKREEVMEARGRSPNQASLL